MLKREENVMKEMIDILNNLGQKNGVIMEKNEAHQKGLIHKTICVWIINSNNELLLQTRSSDVMFPNMMDISFAGHIRAGETPLEAVIREGYEELGIYIEPEKLHYLFSCRVYGKFEDCIENEINDVFLYRDDIEIEKFHFCDNEVNKVSYLSIYTFQKMLKDNSKLFVPNEMHYKILLDILFNHIEKCSNLLN